MGAVAFQKDLGMVHSLAHPLSARHGTHHGLANALMLPASMAFIEAAVLTGEQQRRTAIIRVLFTEAGRTGDSLADETRSWIEELGIKSGLKHHDIPVDDIPALADEAFLDTCHATNLIPVRRDDLAAVYEKAQ
jgi:alcohol dehydrogenase class IV